MSAKKIEPPITSEERARTIRDLESSRDALLSAVHGLNAAQWQFKPSPDAWSVAENLEHIVIVESRVHNILAGMPEAAEMEAGRDNHQIDTSVSQSVSNRTQKITAPERVQPRNAWQGEESRTRFLEARLKTLQLLNESPCLRGRVFPHPFLGPLDGYQWILGAASHCVRHTAQICEVKACAGFPSA